jgi:cytochrome P450
MQPLFHTASLESYAPIINEAVTQLLGNLEHVAKQQEEVDLWRQFGRLTMQIIGRSAFGVEFESQRPAGEPDPPLVDAAQQVFNNTQANIWELCVMILPQPVSWVLGPVLKLMNKLLPPKGQAQLEKAFLMLWNTSTALVENAQAQLSPDQPSKDSSWKWFKDDPENLYRAKGTAPAENSVIGMLMKARNKQTDMNFSDMQVAAQSNTFILAGYETTANTLAFCVYLLCKHPEAQQKLIAEVDAFGKDREPTLADLEQLPYTSAVVNEALRVYPPATFVTREARQDVVVGGYHLPKGTWVHLNIWHMHHNEQYFTDAQKFKPERWLGNREGVKEPNAYMPFGSGPRMCIAFKLALEEAIIALARLYQRYTFELGQELQKQDQLEIRSGITIAPKIGLPVKVLLRSEAARQMTA